MIEAAGNAQDLAVARELFLEYAESLGFSLCFQGFDQELATLPGRYAPPLGAILLAREPEGVAGCVAMRPLDEPGRCEMKRLFVRPAYRGRGLGRALARRVVFEARAAGHREMVLDTLDTMLPAIALYRSLGFVDCPPYGYNPLANAVYLSLAL
jgi:putative acetyltransferase